MVRGEIVPKEGGTLQQVDWDKLGGARDVTDDTETKTMGYRKVDRGHPTLRKTSAAERQKRHAQNRALGVLDLTYDQTERLGAYKRWVESHLRDERPIEGVDRIHARYEDRLRDGGFLGEGVPRRVIRELLDTGRITKEQYEGWMLYLRGEGPYPEEYGEDDRGQESLWEQTTQELAKEHEVETDVDSHEDVGEGGPPEDPFPYKKPTTLPR